MPSLTDNYGEISKLNIPLPFFLRDDAFEIYKHGNPSEYDWTSKGREIIVVVKNRKKSPSKYKPSGSSTSNYEDVDVTIGGYPLECPFDPHENFEQAIIVPKPRSIFLGVEFCREKFEPLPLCTSRSLVKKLYEMGDEALQFMGFTQRGGKMTTPSTIYIACDGQPFHPEIVLVGLSKSKLLEVRTLGMFPRGHPALKMDHLLSLHGILPQAAPVSIHKEVHAIYEKCHGDYPSEGKVYMEFVWSEPTSVFENPPTTAKAKLAIRPCQGDANPYLTEFWAEIGILKNLMEIREKQECAEFTKPFYHQHHKVSLDGEPCGPVIYAIKNLLNHPSTPTWDKNGDDFSSSMAAILERVARADRSDLDFTDRAWAILKDAKTVPELWECFFHIFCNIEEKCWRPYLLPSNSTFFGKILKDLFSEKLANFRSVLTPYLALDMTIEFGIQKLFRDYSFVLKMCHLAEPKDLLRFGPVDCPIERSLEKSLTKIEKLHCLLELLCLSKERLSLPMHELEMQAQIVLDHLAKNELDWDHTYHFDVPMAFLTAILVGVHPVYWNLKMGSSSSVRSTLTKTIICRDLFVPHAKRGLEYDPMVSAYYLYVHRETETRI